MSRALKITTGAAAGLVVAGLIAIAAPAVVGTVSVVTEAGNNLGRTLESPPETDPVTVLDAPREVERNSDDWLNRPKSHLSCSRYADYGVNDYAEGEPVDVLGDGTVKTYRVAEGDTTIGIMERFCTPSSATIFYANDMHLRGYGLTPGEVINIRQY
ncbi:hypothetical protein FBY40_2993 [Microbacterium sp. SLBN-154]|uniref:hypothetical protein n=1 Tax=Microbacterium sp. SLBN-154 TaxID=2768458 RepID=UPI00117464A8|nr:hypothetical protein [Microbacterium sp. SLBN-154]TQK20460.1 hypothetical protein FBY40_2993 [Microbacterium sp. SLBN-154]